MQEVRRIVQIVPRLASVADGVADYARVLAWELHVAHGIDSVFLSGDPGDAGVGTQMRWPAVAAPRRTTSVLQDCLTRLHGSRGNITVVHYANYGYACRGCPAWLVAGLERWKASAAQNRLLAVFHELYAFGPPWRSSFWLSPVQRALARRVAETADAAMTSLPSYGERLRSWGVAADRLWMHGIFSTVGEIPSPAPLSRRQRRLVVFGSAGVRTRLYRSGAASLREWAARLEIEELVDIGPPVNGHGARAGAKPRSMGVLAAAEVSELLRDSYAGAIAYPPGYLGKSTIFAAYCAHGLLPLVYSGGRTEEEEIRPAQHYLLMDALPPAAISGSAQGIAARAHDWYMGHSVARAARWLAGRIAS